MVPTMKKNTLTFIAQLFLYYSVLLFIFFKICLKPTMYRQEKKLINCYYVISIQNMIIKIIKKNVLTLLSPD